MRKNSRISPRHKHRERRRERWKRLFKSLGKLTLLLSLLVGLALIGKEVEDFLLTSPSFQIKEVNFKGATSLGREVLEDLADIKPGENIFQINLNRAKECLERHPWIREASVCRSLPNAVTVRIKKRQAVALFESEQGIYPIDEEGVILPRDNPFSPPAGQPGRSLPLLKGVKPEGEGYKLKVGEKLQWSEMESVLDLLEALTSSYIEISEMDLSPRRPVLRYKGTKVFWGELNTVKHGETVLLCKHSRGSAAPLQYWPKAGKKKKVKELKLILEDLAERKERAEYIDLRFSRPVVKLTRRSAAHSRSTAKHSRGSAAPLQCRSLVSTRRRVSGSAVRQP